MPEGPGLEAGFGEPGAPWLGDGVGGVSGHRGLEDKGGAWGLPGRGPAVARLLYSSRDP